MEMREIISVILDDSFNNNFIEFIAYNLLRLKKGFNDQVVIIARS